MQGVGAALDDAEAAAEIAHRGFVSTDVFGARQQASGDGLDGCERIRKLVAENANQALPRDLLLFLQRLAHVGKQQQGMRRAVLAKERLAQQPARRL